MTFFPAARQRGARMRLWGTVGAAALMLAVSGAGVHAQQAAPAPAPTPAQLGASGGAAPTQGGDPPLEVNASDGIEWRRDEGVYIARGQASAVQGDTEVYADVLTARYHPPADGAASEGEAPGQAGADIYRMEAEGHVRIVMPDQVITGTHGVRDLERGVMWVTGGPPRMETPTQIVTADQTLEYWQARSLAVARGNAVAHQKDNGRTIRADILTALFHDRNTPASAASASASAPAKGARGTGGPGAESGEGASGMRFMTAQGNVEVVTANEVILGDEATYDPATGLAVIVGNVRISTVNGEQLAGTKATVNMKTGVSRLVSDPGGRARALFNATKGATSGAGTNTGAEKPQ